LVHAGLWAKLAAALSACGYQPLYTPSASSTISVGVGQMLIPEPLAAQAAVSGARAELASAGRLSAGDAFPRLALDMLRVDEVSRGIHVQSGVPVAGGMGVAVVVRGRLLAAEGRDPVLDTGDVRRAVALTGDADPRADSASFDQALRSAAERAGHAAARISMGIPEPNDEAP
jgi:hypothetical protein